MRAHERQCVRASGEGVRRGRRDDPPGEVCHTRNTEWKPEESLLILLRRALYTRACLVAFESPHARTRYLQPNDPRGHPNPVEPGPTSNPDPRVFPPPSGAAKLPPAPSPEFPPPRHFAGSQHRSPSASATPFPPRSRRGARSKFSSHPARNCCAQMRDRQLASKWHMGAGCSARRMWPHERNGVQHALLILLQLGGCDHLHRLGAGHATTWGESGW